MEKFEGKSILKEITIGKTRYYSKEKQVVQRNRVDDTAAELQRSASRQFRRPKIRYPASR